MPQQYDGGIDLPTDLAKDGPLSLEGETISRGDPEEAITDNQAREYLKRVKGILGFILETVDTIGSSITRDNEEYLILPYYTPRTKFGSVAIDILGSSTDLPRRISELLNLQETSGSLDPQKVDDRLDTISISISIHTSFGTLCVGRIECNLGEFLKEVGDKLGPLVVISEKTCSAVYGITRDLEEERLPSAAFVEQSYLNPYEVSSLWRDVNPDQQPAKTGSPVPDLKDATIGGDSEPDRALRVVIKSGEIDYLKNYYEIVRQIAEYVAGVAVSKGCYERIAGLVTLSPCPKESDRSLALKVYTDTPKKITTLTPFGEVLIAVGPGCTETLVEEIGKELGLGEAPCKVRMITQGVKGEKIPKLVLTESLSLEEVRTLWDQVKPDGWTETRELTL
jgi:hypothetical protein